MLEKSKEELIKLEAETRIKVMNLQAEVDAKKHGYKMEEFTRELENARILHDLELQRIRIKSAEIRRSRGYK